MFFCSCLSLFFLTFRLFLFLSCLRWLFSASSISSCGISFSSCLSLFRSCICNRFIFLLSTCSISYS
ncbi:MAG: hypothetical protein E6L04_08480 [Thaumarchaeota archaeon]|nr:MAG: hypothetical protein E6L04_08480 [Nitrososphaerota archaeon]TLX87044.1 MAG: hypothetical protein E6K97_09665 [Nitrososphaerota archaeon]